MKNLIAAVFLAALPTVAHAEWFEAQSDHFVIYADDRESDVKRFGEILERYHSAMELLTARKVEKPSPSNRVTIYVVGSEKKIEQLSGSSYIAGFYIPRASGSVAFVPSIQFAGPETDFSLIVLLHEYAHHFLISGSRMNMPTWVGEGAAEFFASSKFSSDGTVQIGMPAYHRAGELEYANNVTVEQLVDPEAYAKLQARGFDSYYGRAWGLYHYLHFEPSRHGQLAAYLNAVTAGTGSREAAEKAFGDLKKLDKDLYRYLLKSIYGYKLPPDKTLPGFVTVRPLSAGMAAMMPLIAVSKRGVSDEDAPAQLAKVRAVAARFPGDAGVLAALAEAEHDAGNEKEAIDAADRAIRIDPTVKNAYVQKGYALFALAPDAPDPDKAYQAAMVPFAALNHLENDHPLPLIYFYRSYVQRGEEPPEAARAALERAALLAPFDLDLAMQAGMMVAREGKVALAIEFIKPVAFDPHGGKRAEHAQAAIAALKGMPEGEPVDTGKLAAMIEVAGSLPTIDVPDDEPDEPKKKKKP